MQEKKNDFRNFLERTDVLAKNLKVSLRELAPIMELSVASLFGYRSGAIRLSVKAWRKLEAAEKAAGIAADDEVNYLKLGELEHEEKPPEPDRIARLEEQIAKLTEAVQKLTEQTAMRTMTQAKATSSPSRGGSTQPKRKTTIPKKLA